MALVQIREVCQSAMLDLPLVVPVVDVTRVVVVVRLVQRVNLGEVHSNRSHMVGHNVNHDPNAHRMSCLNKIL